jgi:hypothetical protein
MLSLPLVFSVLLQAAGPQETGSAGYRPSGSLADLYDLGRLALLRDPAVRVLGFSSSSRAGGDDVSHDCGGFRIRLEDGNAVLAEVPGPGIIQRIWFANPIGEQPGRLAPENEHLRVYVDGRSDPALDVPLNDLFLGKHPRFPRPLVEAGSRGFACYVPIAFRDGCKIVLDGPAVRTYQINMITLPGAEGVTSFASNLAPDDRRELDRAVRFWSRPGDFSELGVRDAEGAVYNVEALGRSSLTFALPDGPRTLRSLEIVPTPETAEAWRGARLRLVWDSEDPAVAGFDLPLGCAFAQADRAEPYRSILAGRDERGWYLHAPMPYRRRALLQIDSPRPIQGRIRLMSVAGIDRQAGYFRAAYVASSPMRPFDGNTCWSDRGRGHYVGIVLTTKGRGHQPIWLEGNGRFLLDGRPAIRGTGTQDDFDGGGQARGGVLERPVTYPSHGVPVIDRDGEAFGLVAYRWHVADPVPYARSILAGPERGEVNTFAADSRAAVFWYSEQPGPAQAGS